MELYLIRHGQSANNLRKQLAEHPRTAPAAAAPRMADPPLTDLGELQARLAGESLRGEGITTLYCGPMLRTLQTARSSARPSCSPSACTTCGSPAMTAPACLIMRTGEVGQQPDRKQALAEQSAHCARDEPRRGNALPEPDRSR